MNVLTFDVEDWFHILDTDSAGTEKDWQRYESRIHPSLDRILELLSRKNQKATFFCLGWVAEHHPDAIRKISELGHETGTHSYAHQLAYDQSPEEFERDLVKSMYLIEDITGKKVRAYRAPGFSVRRDNAWVYDVLVEAGIEIDSSIFPCRRFHGGFSGFGRAEPLYLRRGGARIKELPINKFELFGASVVFSGGGYFRLCPYPMIRSFMQKSGYVMSYFHPRDFDVEQPVLGGLSFAKRFRCYVGISSALQKLERMLDEFDFCDVETIDRSIDWSAVRIVDIDAI